jgi:hypothetical protein
MGSKVVICELCYRLSFAILKRRVAFMLGMNATPHDKIAKLLGLIKTTSNHA